MQTRLLDHGWTLSRRGAEPPCHRPQITDLGTVQGHVPGAVHRDLHLAGVIPDPMQARYEYGVQWVDESDWTYSTEFEWQDHGYSESVLQFDGLDTIARVYLNDHLILSSDNFFLSHEVNVRALLKPGQNTLRVELDSAVHVGLSRRSDYFAKNGIPESVIWFDERAFVRKPGYASGWDWGPRLVGAGIHRPIRLVEFYQRVQGLDLEIIPEGGIFRVIARSPGAELKLELSGDAEILSSEIRPGLAEWHIDRGLWWPHGMGEQILHQVTARVGDHEISKKFGLKTIELRRDRDAVGESFEFWVNHVPVWARGANWIPNDSFIGCINQEEMQAQIRRYPALGFNMLRVWGGGQYESEEFYDVCDELGILVWQDFPYACMYYPDDEHYQAVAEAEAREQIRRLRHRACLALWCGNNENLTMWQGRWGDQGHYVDRYYGENIYEGALRRALAAEGPHHPYIPSSPIGSDPDAPKPECNMGRWGDSHYWDVWHGRGDWIHYQDSDTRFSSEFGFASACTPEAWQQVADNALSLSPSHPTVRSHDKTAKGEEKFFGMVEIHYPKSETLEDWIYYSQLNQRDALRYGIEHFRRKEFCRGTLIWQINDCWPVQSWAVEDYTRQFKPAGFELARLYRDVMVSIDHRPGEATAKVYVCNASREDQACTLEIQSVRTADASAGPSETVELELEPMSVVLATVLTAPFALTESATRLRLNQDDRWMLWDHPKNMKLAPPAVSVQGGKLTVTGLLVDGILRNPEAKSPAEQFEYRSYTLWNDAVSIEVPSACQHIDLRSLHGRREV